MPPTVAARPDDLLRFAATSLPAAGALLAEVPALDAALARARSTLGARLLPEAGLAGRVLAHGRLATAVAHRTAALGLALDTAGGRPSPGPSRPLRGLDDDAVAALVAAAIGLPLHPSGSAGSTVDPDAVARVAARFSPQQLARLAAEHPRLVGPVDGMPVELRFAANRVLIADARRAAEHDGDDDRADQLQRLHAPGRQILRFDPSGDGQVAEVLGDLATATDVAVVVPGMANSLANFDRGTAAKAVAIHEAAGPGTAAVAWLGYDSPDGASAALDDAALDGADRLRRLLDGLPEGARRTVVGHSYGTVVTAQALRDGLEVDQVVVTGSPGMLAPTAAALAGDVPIWAARAPGDAVGWSENFGRDPSDPRFGATRFATGPMAWHSSYFDEGTESLANIVRIVTGRTAEVTVTAPDPVEVVLGVADDLQRRLDPTDAVQDVVAGGAGAVSDAVDGIEPLLPEPVAELVDDAQAAAGTALEVGNRATDLGQRLTSVDLWGDVALDGIDLVDAQVDDIAGAVADGAGDLVEGVRRLGGLLG